MVPWCSVQQNPDLAPHSFCWNNAWRVWTCLARIGLLVVGQQQSAVISLETLRDSISPCKCKDTSFQLHLSHFLVTRPCLYSRCICLMSSVWVLFLSCTQFWICTDFKSISCWMITAIMKHPHFFYMRSSGNQQMRLSSSTLIEMQYHQINLMDSIKNPLLAFFSQSYRLGDSDIYLHTF